MPGFDQHNIIACRSKVEGTDDILNTIGLSKFVWLQNASKFLGFATIYVRFSLSKYTSTATLTQHTQVLISRLLHNLNEKSIFNN